MINCKRLVAEFITVAELSGVSIPKSAVTVEKLCKPHEPPKTLPKGKMAVYVFFWNSECLKVGKVGPRSEARYTSQHYSPNSSNSNLAKSILNRKSDFGAFHLTEPKIGQWIKKNTSRINFLLDQNLGISVVSLMEAFLQCRLKPKFEGFRSQK